MKRRRIGASSGSGGAARPLPVSRREVPTGHLERDGLTSFGSEPAPVGGAGQDALNEEEIVRLRKMLSEAEERAGAMEDEAFALKSELFCKVAEERHGKSHLIENLQTQLAFRQRELEGCQAALHEEQRLRTQLQKKAALAKKKERVALQRHSSSQGSTQSDVKSPIQERPVSGSNLSSSSFDRVVLPDFLTSEDMYLVMRAMDRANAIGLSQASAERILIDEIAKHLNEKESEEGDVSGIALIRIFSKYVRKAKLSLDTDFIADFFVPNIEPLLERKGRMPEHVLGFLVSATRNTKTACATGFTLCKMLCEWFAKGPKEEHRCRVALELLNLLVSSHGVPEGFGLEDLMRMMDLCRIERANLAVALQLCFTIYLQDSSFFDVRELVEDQNNRAKLLKILRDAIEKKELSNPAHVLREALQARNKLK